MNSAQDADRANAKTPSSAWHGDQRGIKRWWSGKGDGRWSS
jgi:hypothetical protein